MWNNFPVSIALILTVACRNCRWDAVRISQKCHPWPKGCVIASVQLLKQTTHYFSHGRSRSFPCLLLRALLLLLCLAFFLSHSGYWSCNCRSLCWVLSGTMNGEMKGACHAGVPYSHPHTHGVWLTRSCSRRVSLTAGQSRHRWWWWVMTKAECQEMNLSCFWLKFPSHVSVCFSVFSAISQDLNQTIYFPKKIPILATAANVPWKEESSQ